MTGSRGPPSRGGSCSSSNVSIGRGIAIAAKPIGAHPKTILSGRFVQGAATAKLIGAHPTLGCPFTMYQILSVTHVKTHPGWRFIFPCSKKTVFEHSLKILLPHSFWRETVFGSFISWILRTCLVRSSSDLWREPTCIYCRFHGRLSYIYIYRLE